MIEMKFFIKCVGNLFGIKTEMFTTELYFLDVKKQN